MTGRVFISAAAALILMLAAAAAQEKAESSDGVEIKHLLENNQMKVMEIRFKPGAKTSTVSHPNRFVYGLTDGSLVFSPPGKTPYELTFKRGEAIWLPADSMATQNDTDKEVRALVVEISGGGSRSESHSAASSSSGRHGKRHGRRGRGGGRKRGSK